jgi:tetratricopeptide (TPR) repeat protein
MWHPQAQLGLGLVLFQQQAYDVARQQMQDVQLTAPPAWVAREAQMVEGLCDLQLKEYGAAAVHFRHLLGEAPDPATRAKAAFYLGEALTGLKETTPSLQAYHEAIEADPQSVWARLANFGLGWSLFQQHRCAESLKALDDYVTASGAEADRQQPELLFAQGRCLLELGDDRAAVARLETLRRTSPTHPLALEAAISLAEARQASLNGQGDAHMAMGQAEEASRCYQQAWAMGPEKQGGSYALYQLGRLKLQAGKTDEAMESFRQVIDRGTPAQADPLAADARLALAAALLSNAQPAQARQELERLRTLAPESAQAARAGYYLALLAWHEDHDADAQRFCQDVIRRVPRSEEAIQARLLLADVAVEQGTPVTTLPTLFDELQLPPEASVSSGARDDYRGRLAKKFGDLAQQARAHAHTIHWYELAWEALPEARGELDYAIAFCYEQAGDQPLAVHRYRAITQPPWQVRGQLAAAKLMERDQQWQEAMAIYKTITQQPVPEAKIAKERLALLERAQPGNW